MGSISVESSMSYEINSYLDTDITNADKTSVLDNRILSIKSSDDLNYKTFSNQNTKITIVDNHPSGSLNNHSIDLRLNGGIDYKTDVYKAVLKIEVKQK